MRIDENLRLHYENKYEKLSLLERSLHDYGSSYLISIFLGVALLPAMGLSESRDYYFFVVLWIYWGWSVFRTLKHIAEKNTLLSEIHNMERNLIQFSKLKFCACGKFNTHFFSPETEQLYNIKSDILFDKHPLRDYEVWHSQFKPEPRWRKNFYVFIMSLFLLINIALILYV